MATESLVPVSLTDAQSNVAAGAYTDIANGVASASGNTLDSVTNDWTNGTGPGSAFTFGITNAPADFGTFTSVKLVVRARVTGGVSDDAWEVILDINGTNAPTDTIVFDDLDDGGGFIEREFTNSAVTPSQADIDGWIVRAYQSTWVQEKGPDGLNFEIDEIELTLTYSASAISALGTITFSASLDGTNVTRAFGTITAAGDLGADGHSLVPATGTSTITGDLTATNHSLGFAVSTYIGQLDAGGGASLAFGTSTATATLDAVGTDVSAGSSGAASGIAFASAQHRFYERQPPSFFGQLPKSVAITTAAGTIAVSASLDAVGKSLAFGTSTVTGDLAALATTNARGTITALGQGLSEATHLAKGAIEVAGDLAGVGNALQSAVGTINITGDLAADSKSLAIATSSISGDVVADGTNIAFESAAGTITVSATLDATQRTNVAGTITALGQGLSEAVHLAFGQINLSGDAVVDAISLQGAAGTITLSSDVAASGTQLANGLSSFVGELSAAGTGGAAGSIPPGKSLLSLLRQDNLRDQSVLKVGASGPYGIISASGTITAIASVDGIGTQPTVSGSISVSGSLTAQSGIYQVSGTITIFGAASGSTPPVEGEIASVSIFADEVPVPASFAFLGKIPPPADVVSALIRLSSSLSVGDDLTKFAFATIDFLGSVSTAGEGKVYASGTITASATLASTDGRFVLAEVSGSVSIAGSLAAVSGNIQPRATITVFGLSEGLGTISDRIEESSATITASVRLDATGNQFCPVRASGSIVFSAELTQADISQSIHGAFGSIHIGASLSAAAPTFIEDNGISLARGTIRLLGDMSEAEIRKVTCITPTATFLVPGFVLSAFGGDLNQKFATASIQLSATLDISAIYVREVSVTLTGALSALGRNLPIGDLAMKSARGLFLTGGQIGAGTIDGQKRALIQQPFGSIELYNNGQGGFYSIGAADVLKEAFCLINVTSLTAAKGTRDQTQYRAGTISISSHLASGDPITLATASVSIIASGTLAASGSVPLSTASASIGLSASASADGLSMQPFSPSYNGAQSPTRIGDSLADYEYSNFGPGSAAAVAYTQVTVENGAADTVLNIVGSESGSGVDQGGYEQVSTDIFNLNVRADSVKIREFSVITNDSDASNYPSTNDKVGSFVNNLAFNATNGIKYGYRANSDVQASDPPNNPPGVFESGTIETITEFTFTKAGYQPLTVAYKIRATAVASAEDVS